MVGHVGDFGLARLLFDATQDSSIEHSSSIGVRGTVGYTPPGEYYYPFLNLTIFPFFFPVLYCNLKLERKSLTGIYCS